MDEKVSDTPYRDTFRYPSNSIFSIYFPVFVGALVVFSILVGRRNGLQDGIFVFLFLVPFFSFLGLVSMLGFSDVVVENDGLSRKMYGWTWRRLRWNEISCIKIRSRPTRTGVMTVLIFLSTPSASNGKSRRIAFSKDIDMLGKLVTRTNEFIAKFHISVVDERSGVVTQTNHLPFLTQDDP